MTTMFGVKDQWNLALSIGGKDFIPANPTTIKQLFWFESVHQAIPSLNLSFIDQDGSFADITSAGDGVPIEITLGDGGYSGETTATFNIVGQPQTTRGTGYSIIKLNAVLDGLPYMRSIVNGLFEGTSSNVLQQIASQVGFSFDGDTTSDHMTWLPNNKTLFGFAKHVAMHGWIDAGACLMMAVTDQKKLIYKNIMNPASVGENFVDGNDGSIQIVDWSGTSNAILTNNNRGYGSTSFGFNPEGLLQEFNKVTFNLLSSFLPISARNVSALGQLGGRLDNIIRSAGNTHDNYDQAFHQNKRMRATFASNLNIITAQVTKSELLHRFNAVPTDFTTNQPSSTYSGDYLLESRTKSLIRSKYVERIVGCTQGTS